MTEIQALLARKSTFSFVDTMTATLFSLLFFSTAAFDPSLRLASAQQHQSQNNHVTERQTHFDDYSSRVAAAPLAIQNVSPECWTSAMRHLVEDDSTSQLGTAVCASMTHEHEKALSLALAGCQLTEVGRLLFIVNTDDEEDKNSSETCQGPSFLSGERLKFCLSRLTNDGLDSYREFFMFVRQTCTRLTSELWMEKQQQTTLDLAKASQAAVYQLQTIMEFQQNLQKQQELRERQLQEQHEERDRQLQEALQRQTDQHESMLQFQQQLLTTEEAREEAQKQLESEWTKHRQELTDLTKSVGEAAGKMKPLGSLLSLATMGVSYASSLFYFLAAINITWLLTFRHQPFRRFMFGLLCLEFLLEWTIHLTCEDVSAIGTDIRTLRWYTGALECGVYMLGLVVSCFWSGARQQEDTPSPQVIDEAIRQMQEIVAKQMEDAIAEQKAEAQQRETHLVQLLAEQRQHVSSVLPVGSGEFLQSPPGYSRRQSRRRAPSRDAPTSPPGSVTRANSFPPYEYGDREESHQESPLSSTNLATVNAMSTYSPQQFQHAETNDSSAILRDDDIYTASAGQVEELAPFPVVSPMQDDSTLGKRNLEYLSCSDEEVGDDDEEEDEPVRKKTKL